MNTDKTKGRTRPAMLGAHEPAARRKARRTNLRAVAREFNAACDARWPQFAATRIFNPGQHGFSP